GIPEMRDRWAWLDPYWFSWLHLRPDLFDHGAHLVHLCAYARDDHLPRERFIRVHDVGGIPTERPPATGATCRVGRPGGEAARFSVCANELLHFTRLPSRCSIF